MSEFYDTLLTADCLITQNSERDILKNAFLGIKEGKIAAIGKTEDLFRKEWHARERIELASSLVLPALINAHAHTSMTFLRGLADDLPLLEWLTANVFPIEKALDPAIVRIGAMLGQSELLAGGCGTCIDMYIYEAAVLEAAELTGVRCMGGEAIFDFPSAACSTPEDALRETERLAGKYAGHERIRIAVNPHSVYTTSTHTLNKCRELARELDLPVHIHLAETRTETELCLEKYGNRPVARALENELFAGRGIAAHLVDITHEEAQELAQAGVVGVHNPSSNMKLASGAAPVSLSLAAGLRLALGTDGPASNNQLNMFQEMRQTALLAKVAEKDPQAMPAQTVLDMATLGGADAFGLAGGGRLEVGSPADLIALDLKKPNMLPLYNPVSQAVYAANGSECQLTMIAGEILYQNGKFSRFDYTELIREAEALKEFVKRNH